MRRRPAWLISVGVVALLGACEGTPLTAPSPMALPVPFVAPMPDEVRIVGFTRIVQDGTPLEGAQANAPHFGRSTATSADGSYELLIKFPEGTDEMDLPVRARAIGFTPAIRTVRVKRGQVVKVDLELKRDSMRLSNCPVVGAVPLVAWATGNQGSR